jgi:hypothetical protein
MEANRAEISERGSSAWVVILEERLRREKEYRTTNNAPVWYQVTGGVK